MIFLHFDIKMNAARVLPGGEMITEFVPRFESFTCACCQKSFKVSEVKEYYFSESGGRARTFCAECFKRGQAFSPGLFYKEKFRCIPGGSWGMK